jgi:probable rRNA maturation factor
MARGGGLTPRARRPRIDVAREGVRGMSDAAVTRAASATITAARKRIGSLSITFLSVAAMRRMNAKHLGRSGLTDVIAFSLAEQGVLAGDVYISPDAARLSAHEHRVSMREELTRLVVHGTLHVLGWDHPEGDRRLRSAMWRKQEAIVEKLMRLPR